MTQAHFSFGEEGRVISSHRRCCEIRGALPRCNTLLKKKLICLEPHTNRKKTAPQNKIQTQNLYITFIDFSCILWMDKKV
jgi:hypothetical protein